tara:strand:+ start:433 stop:564 length:132 start_codon:yes stop_codon:yes gene_type:complete
MFTSQTSRRLLLSLLRVRAIGQRLNGLDWMDWMDCERIHRLFY